MLNLYCTKRGDFSPASSLTVDEAVELFESGMLHASDVLDLQSDARRAVLERFQAFEVEARIARSGSTVIWGRKRGDVRPVIDGGEA